MRIIAISGHAQNGKDTAANMLYDIIRDDYIKENNETADRVLVTHYADLVKYVCKTFFAWDGLKDARGRTLLQYVGTDVVRSEEPEFWVNFIIKMLKFFGKHWDWVIIPDTRFPNEIQALRDNGFDVVHMRIERPGHDSGLTEEQKKHPSETALDDSIPDILIHNIGDLCDLRETLQGVYAALKQQ